MVGGKLSNDHWRKILPRFGMYLTPNQGRRPSFLSPINWFSLKKADFWMFLFCHRSYFGPKNPEPSGSQFINLGTLKIASRTKKPRGGPLAKPHLLFPWGQTSSSAEFLSMCHVSWMMNDNYTSSFEPLAQQPDRQQLFMCQCHLLSRMR